MGMVPAEFQTKAQLISTICDSAERFGWLFHVARDMAHGGSGPTPAEIRSRRRAYERTIKRNHADLLASVGDLWPEYLKAFGVPAVGHHRPRTAISSLVLYVLTAVVDEVVEHFRARHPEQRPEHARQAGRLVRSIIEAAAVAPDLSRRGLDRYVVARLLDLERKLVERRLDRAAVCAEIRAARQRGRSAWVSRDELLWAASYRDDEPVIAELMHNDASQRDRGRPAGVPSMAVHD